MTVSTPAPRLLLRGVPSDREMYAFCVQYAPGGLIKEHDHAFEEAYFFLSGEIEATADGETQILRAGDCFWTGVGCPHAFTNRSSESVRWVETQVPQPPARDAARFTADWPAA